MMPFLQLLGQSKTKFGVELDPRRAQWYWKKLPNSVTCNCSAKITPSHFYLGSLGSGCAGCCGDAGGLLGEMCTCGGGDHGYRHHINLLGLKASSVSPCYSPSNPVLILTSAFNTSRWCLGRKGWLEVRPSFITALLVMRNSSFALTGGLFNTVFYLYLRFSSIHKHCAVETWVWKDLWSCMLPLGTAHGPSQESWKLFIPFSHFIYRLRPSMKFSWSLQVILILPEFDFSSKFIVGKMKSSTPERSGALVLRKMPGKAQG